jgi:hypothetical protein
VDPRLGEVHVSRDSRDEKRGADSEGASQPAVLTYFEWVSEILDEHEVGERDAQSPPRTRNRSAA